ncbi:MAG: hypothetical protein DWQ37_04805 [Planctomycetota bacterium]|nr:MAG: hypothetical protein DWQ37_04805 [Planctomycetota bacterium]
MRLTLRTLLAYLDGNLEPADAEDIGKKIEESEFATKLVHLIRDCTRRLRLDTPALVGRGLAADPNSVAEYLEYRLDDDRVPEFEKICLESEAHLAEVASCHQILTLVLGEPAEIEPNLRTRLYALAGHVDAPPPQGDSVSAGAATTVAPGTTAAPPTPPVVRRPKPEVPDYLREKSWRWGPIVAMVLIGTLLTFAGLLAFGPPHLRDRVTALWSPPAEDAEQAEAPAPPPDSATEPVEEDVPEGPPAAEEPPAEKAEPAEAAVVDDAPPGEVEMPAAATPSVPTPAAPPTTDEPGSEPAPADEPGPSAPAAEMATDAETVAAPLPPEPTPIPADLNPGGDVTPAEMPEGAAPGSPTPGAPAPEGAPAEPVPAPTPPPSTFGRLSTSKLEILLKFDPDSGDWMRMPAAAPLQTGDVLLSPPLYRPTLNLSTNLNVQADGAARFELAGWSPEQAPILDVAYGRFLMLTVGKGSNPLKLRVDGHETLLTFVDPESTLALEVVRERVPGQDPVAEPSTAVVHVYSTGGLIRIEDEAGAIQELPYEAMASIVGGAVQDSVQAALPEWTTTEQLTDAQGKARRELGGYLEKDKPIGLQLRELASAQHVLARHREVRTLAVRCLAQLDEFDSSLAALDDPDLRHYWADVMGELQAAVVRSPESATKVQTALERHRGAADGALLYRMLWGYTGPQLKAGADRELVEALGRNDALIVRVMGLLTLEDITGATLSYHPEDTEFQRRVPYTNWQRRVGRIVPREEVRGAGR